MTFFDYHHVSGTILGSLYSLEFNLIFMKALIIMLLHMRIWCVKMTNDIAVVLQLYVMELEFETSISDLTPLLFLPLDTSSH